METANLYNGEVVLEFNEGNHRFKANGEYVPVSVTGVTGIIDKSGPLMYWACNCMRDHLLAEYESGNYSEEVIEKSVNAFRSVKKQACDTGTMVHDFCENFGKYKMGSGDKPDLPDNEQAVAGINAFLKWYNENEVEFLALEKMIYSRTFNYAGKFDLMYRKKSDPNKLILADYKTSKRYYPVEHRLQTAGYMLAETEEAMYSGREQNIIARETLMFGKETGEFTVHRVDNDLFEVDKEVFISALKLKMFVKENEK